MTPDKATALREAAERVGVTHAENLAQLLHARSCAERGVEARWRGRNTNRAYYRRIARAEIARQALEATDDQ